MLHLMMLVIMFMLQVVPEFPAGCGRHMWGGGIAATARGLRQQVTVLSDEELVTSQSQTEAAYSNKICQRPLHYICLILYGIKSHAYQRGCTYLCRLVS